MKKSFKHVLCTIDNLRFWRFLATWSLHANTEFAKEKFLDFWTYGNWHVILCDLWVVLPNLKFLFQADVGTIRTLKYSRLNP